MRTTKKIELDKDKGAVLTLDNDEVINIPSYLLLNLCKKIQSEGFEKIEINFSQGKNCLPCQKRPKPNEPGSI